MPFSTDFGDLYKFGIKKVADEYGVVAERIDEQHFSESILERIYRQIENCDFIIAEMTGKNPNVFYEVGYAHARGKQCALITQDASDIPFDLKHHTHVVYDGSIGDLAEELRPKIAWLKEEAEKRKTEVIRASVAASSGLLEKETYSDYGSFDLTLTLRNATARRSPEIEAIYIRTTKRWEISVGGVERPTETIGDMRRTLITPPIRRLSPNAFLAEKIELRAEFWSKFGDQERKEEYQAKGNIEIEIATSEGSLEFNFPIDVTFDEFPF